MLVYEGTKSDFIQSVEADVIASEIKNKIKEKMGRTTTDSEYNSWDNSLQFMYKVMNDSEIPNDSGIAIEYNVPLTSKRVDFIISGYDDKKHPGVIIIELKQWTKLEKVDNSALVRTFTGRRIRDVVHPSYQAWSYSQLISDYNSSVQNNDVYLKPCSYLHNYIRRDFDPVDDSQYSVYTEKAPVFSKGQVFELRDFIKETIKIGDNKKILYEIDNGKIKPSKSLQDTIVSMMKGNEEFYMIDEQRVVFDQIMKLSLKCQKDQKKRTIIVEGGPGTGKSVIAVQLLSALTQKDQFVQYVTKNAAPRTVYKNKLVNGDKTSGVENLFKGSDRFHGVGNNMIHTLIVDEAHRLELRSQYTKNTGDNNQIKEIIHAAKCSVFFIDENQRVTTSDIGSVAEIEKCAKIENSEVFKMKLESQFRCNGSDGYLAWVDDLLNIKQTANFSLEGIDYDIQVFDNPHELRNKIIEKNQISNKSRMVAGYCWEWPKKFRADTEYHDIIIGDFEISWNLDGGEAFATDKNSINEAGCIHTTQGLEFDYVGVIIGDDLRYENGKLVTDFKKRATTDQSIKGFKKRFKTEPEKVLQEADEIIKNTYRTLMTRGMKGCYIYCTNKELSDYIKERIKIRN